MSRSSLPIAKRGRYTSAEHDDLLKDTSYQEIARRILLGQPYTLICEAVQISRTTFNRYIADPHFKQLYHELRDKMYGNVDALLIDEKQHDAIRAAALRKRALTLNAEVLAAVQDHIDAERQATGHAGGSRSTILKAGVDAVRVAMEHSEKVVPQGMGTTVNVQQNFMMPPKAAQIMRDVVAESGVDLSDIFDAEVVEDAEPDAVGGDSQEGRADQAGNQSPVRQRDGETEGGTGAAGSGRELLSGADGPEGVGTGS